MGITSVDYILAGGNRFAAREPGFRRAHVISQPSQIKASTPDAPFLDADVTDFSAGIKPDQMDDAATWIKSAVGWEPTGASGGLPYSLLKIGMTLDQQYTAAGAGELVPLAADRGVIYAGEQGSATVLHSTDGTTWTAVATASGGGNVLSLCAFQGLVFAGFDNRYVYTSLDQGATWAQVADITAVTMPDASFSPGTPHAASCSLILADPLSPKAFPEANYLYLVGENYPSQGATNGARASILCYLTSLYSGALGGLCVLPEPYCKAGVIHAGAIWLCAAETAAPVRGVVYSKPLQSLDTSNNPPTLVGRMDDNYATSAASFQGRTYWGCNARGELYVCDGSTLSLLRTFTTSKPIRGMVAFRGALWVTVHNDTDGRIELWRYDGSAWSMPNYVSATLTAVGRLVPFLDRLHVAAGNSTTRRIYGVSATNRCTTAQLDLADAVYGVPSDNKRYRRLRLRHAALASGQAVQVLYSLDGGSYTAVGTNRRAGSTRTQFELPDGIIGGRLSGRFVVTNGAAQDMTAYGGATRALPAPDARERWSVDLELAPVDNGGAGKWADGTADSADAIRKLELLAALHDQAQVFQAVDPFRDAGGMPRRAMLATLDLRADFAALFSKLSADIQAKIPIQIVQAASPANLLDNASFEQDGAGSHPTSWTLSGTLAAYQSDTAAFAADGTRVLTMQFDGVAAAAGVTQTVGGLVPGRYYTLSVYIRRSSLTHGTVRAKVTEGATEWGTTTALGTGTDGAFGRQTATFLLGANSTGTVVVQLVGEDTPANGDTVYWDAVQLEEGAPASNFVERGQ